MDNQQRTEVDAAFDAAQKLHPFEVKDARDGSSAPYAVIPNGVRIESLKSVLDLYLTRPERRTGTVCTDTLDSFTEAVDRFKGATTVLFANTDGPNLLAIFNWHEPGEHGRADYGDHRASYVMPVSEQWRAWVRTKLHFDQKGLAEFLEDRIADVVNPDVDEIGEGAADYLKRLHTAAASPSTLLELSGGLSLTVKANVTNEARLSSGESTISYKEEHADAQGKKLQVPGAFIIGIPVFRGGDHYSIAVRLRYRVDGGKIMWSLEPYRTDEIYDAAFCAAAEAARDTCALPLIYGEA